MSNTDLAFPSGNVKAVIAHFDKVAFRSSTAPNKAALAVLRANAAHVSVRFGHPIRSSDRRFLITITVPKGPALVLAEECGWAPNYIEPALDNIVSERSDALALHYFLDGTFVHSWHGKQQLVRVNSRRARDPFDEEAATLAAARDPYATTYSGQRWAKRIFVWYSDHLSKITGQPCLHLESRYRGADTLRRLGVYTAADLIHFDHLAHWQRYLACYCIDPDQLGRSNANTNEGHRRQKPRDDDAAKGSLLFRALSAHENQEMRSVQRFIDQYGRGAFLHRFDVSALLSLAIDYMRQTIKLNNHLNIIDMIAALVVRGFGVVMV